MRIAITGGTGLLGRYFVRLLNQQGIHKPIILSRSTSIVNYNSEVRTTDYSVESLIDALSAVDTVVHLAVHRGNNSILRDYHTNSDITQNLYEACAAKNIKNVVYASSISVYSQTTMLPWEEELAPIPISLYGISKLIGEHLGNIYSKKYDMNIVNLRLAHIFGCAEQNENMINKFIRQSFTRETLVLYSEQTAKREFLYAKDAAHALLCAVQSNKAAGTINIGSEEVFTNQEVAEIINKAFHNEGNLQVENREGIVIDSSYMNSKKAYLELGFKPRYSFYEAMKEIYGEMLIV